MEKIIRKVKGFTIMELLVVIAIIGILAAVVFVILKPGEQRAKARNVERTTAVNTIVNAVYQYAVDNNGNLPASITDSPTEICQTGGSCSGLVDLSVLTANQKYLVSIPADPTGASANGAGYEISKNANGRVTVSAPDAEGQTINITR